MDGVSLSGWTRPGLPSLREYTLWIDIQLQSESSALATPILSSSTGPTREEPSASVIAEDSKGSSGMRAPQPTPVRTTLTDAGDMTRISTPLIYSSLSAETAVTFPRTVSVVSGPIFGNETTSIYWSGNCSNGNGNFNTSTSFTGAVQTAPTAAKPSQSTFNSTYFYPSTLGSTIQAGNSACSRAPASALAMLLSLLVAFVWV